MVTRHGIYIDGFAGPQEEEDYEPEKWAVNLALNNEPRWLTHFYLYDLKKSQYLLLEELKAAQPERDAKGRKIRRKIHVEHGDFNELIHELLSSKKIRQKAATFALLDQRTFECKWSTVEALAKYKEDGNNKIELFYFLPNSWQDRALAAQKDLKVIEERWGRDDWDELRQMQPLKRKDTVVERFKTELGYQWAHAWAIYNRQEGGRIMYYMIHATDHPEAPRLMERAYHKAVTPKEPVEQLKLFLSNTDETSSNQTR